MKRSLLLFLIVLSSLYTFGQELVKVGGTVDAKDKNALFNINVMLKGKNGNYGGVTNDIGYFEFKAKPGKYKMIISSLIFEKVEKDVVIKAGKYNHFYNIQLRELVNDLDEVVVTGTKTAKSLSKTPVLTKLVSQKDIAQVGAVSALDALENIMPGVQFSPDAHGNNMSIQGLDNSYTLVLLNGERMVGETRGNVNFDRISADDIKQIEIISGASSVLYGSNAIGGVVNIITKDAEKKIEGKVNARYADFNTWNTGFSVGSKGEKYKVMLKGFRNSSDGYDLTPDSEEEFTANPFEDYSLSTDLSYNFNKKLSASAHGMFFRHEVFNPSMSLKSTHIKNKNYTYGVKLNYDFSDNHNLLFNLNSDMYHSFMVFDKIDSADYKKNDYRYSTYSLTDRLTILENLHLVNGLEWNRERVFSYNLFGEINEEDVMKRQMVLTFLRNWGKGLWHQGYNFSDKLLGKAFTEEDKNKKTNDLNFFTQVDWNILDDLELIAAMRYTHHSRFGSHFVPNTSIMYTVLPGLKLRGTAALGYKSPSLKELYYNFDHRGMFWIFGNKNLKPESSTYYSMSTEYTYKTLNVSVNAYHNHIDNKIGQIATIENINGEEKQAMHYQNIQEVRIRGIEAYLNYSCFSHLKLKASYAFSDAFDKVAKRQMNGNSKHTGTVSLTLFNSKGTFPFSLTLSNRTASPRIYFRSDINTTTGQVTTIEDKTSVRSIWKLTGILHINTWKEQGLNVDLKCGVNNLTDNTDIERLGSIDPGRVLWTSIAIRF